MCVAGWIGNPIVPDEVEYEPWDEQFVLVWELFQYNDLSDESDDEMENTNSDATEPMDEGSFSDESESPPLRRVYLLTRSEEMTRMRSQDVVQAALDR